MNHKCSLLRLRYDSAPALLRPEVQQTPANIDLLRPEALFRPWPGGTVPLSSLAPCLCVLCALSRQKFPTPVHTYQHLRSQTGTCTKAAPILALSRLHT